MKRELRTTECVADEAKHLVGVDVSNLSAGSLDGCYVRREAVVNFDGVYVPVRIKRILAGTWWKDGKVVWNVRFICNCEQEGINAFNDTKPTLEVWTLDEVPEEDESQYIKVRWMA